MSREKFKNVDGNRSRNMAAIKSQDTKPEMIVRRMVRSLGIGYRLHRKEILGKPDLAFIGRKKLIFVHGCFWHQHGDKNCPLRHSPKTRLSYWNPKLKKNKERDARNRKGLTASGWDVLVVWECETRDHQSLPDKLDNFLNYKAS